MTPYIICSSPRSGTNLLRHLLTWHKIGIPTEIHRDYIDFRRTPVEEMESVFQIEYLHNFLKGCNFVPAHRDYSNIPIEYYSRTVWSFQFHEMIKNLRGVASLDSVADKDVLSTLYPGIKYIYLYRKDKIKQAVSIEMARQSDEWLVTKTMPVDRYTDYSYDFGDLARELIWRFDAEVVWQDIFEEFDIRPLVLCHEDFLADMVQGLADIAEFLGAGIAYPSPEYIEKSLSHASAPIKPVSPTKTEWVNFVHRDLDRIRTYTRHLTERIP